MKYYEMTVSFKRERERERERAKIMPTAKSFAEKAKILPITLL
jgi:hypothetical protein